jgi:ribosomal RNA-processing protein 36
VFRKSYAWLGEVKDNEIAALKAELAGGSSKAARKAARGMDPERREGLQALLSQLRQQRTDERVGDAVRAGVAARKAEERAAVAAGKAPYFPKRRELRELAASERFKLLEGRGDGAVAKALLKRRKKLAGKERKGGATAGGGGGVYAPFSARRGVDAAEGR